MKRFYCILPLIIQRLLWLLARIIFNFFCHLEVRGLENLSSVNTKKGLIFVANHTTECDPVLLPASLPFFSPLFPMFFVSRPPDFYDTSGWFGQVFYGGLFFKAGGGYPVYRKRYKSDYALALRHHIAILNDGGTVCIFPEGRITSDGKIKKVRVGVAYLTNVTKAPIIPVRIDGSFGMTFKEFFSRGRTVTVSFGKPIYPQDLFIDKDLSGLSEDEFFQTLKKAAKIVMAKVKTI